MLSIQEHIPLAPFTTFQIGGPARFLLRAQSVDDVRKALSFAKERNLPLLILGGGSNMLVSDEGFSGVVLKIELRGIEFSEDGFVRVASGEAWDALVAQAVERGLWGLENLSGIPGSVGASPVQNIGAYGAEIADVFESAEAIDRESGETISVANAQCGFGYRTSIFKKNPERYVILSVMLQLSKKGSPNLPYRDLAAAFAGRENPSLYDIREAVLAIRARKFPDLAREGTAGSFFLNPVVSEARARDLSGRFPGLPAFPAEGSLPAGKAGIKISLAHILDQLGLKGLSHGKARLFEYQPLVLVAERGASARDVRTLADVVARRVKDATDIDLEREVCDVTKN